MKGKLALCCTVLLAALLIVGVALACEDPRPPAPTCPDGQIETSPAVWVPEVPAVEGACHVVVRGQNMSQYYKHDGNSANCSLRNSESWRRFFWPFPPQTAQGAWVPGTPAIPGYWIAPVCRVPIAGCMDPLALNYNAAAEVDDGSCTYAPIETEEPPIETEEPPIETEEPPVTEEPPIETEEPPITTPEPTPEPPTFCTYTVTTYFQCNTGAAIWVQETGITSGDGSNFVGYAPYNRECGFCDGITGIYHRHWVNDCDGTGWDEGTWNMPEEFHELNGCPLGGRCVGQ